MTLMSSLLLASLAGSALMACPIPVPTDPESPWTPSPRREDYPWMSRVEWCQRFQAQLQDPAREGTQLVFMGDSITQGWTDQAEDIWRAAFGHLQALRLGIGGDRTQNLLWRIENGELAGLNPRVLVLLIGINNLSAGDTPDATAQGVRAVVDRIRAALPQSKILLLGLLPSGALPSDPLRDRIQMTNLKLQELSQDSIHYYDIGRGFFKDDGSIDVALMPDYLHPNVDGYRLMAKALQPILVQLFGADIVDISAIEKNITLTVPQ